MAPDDFLCEKIIFLVTCESNNKEAVQLVPTVKIAVQRADKILGCKSLAIPLLLLPETIMEKKEQTKEIARALKKLPNLTVLEELFVCESSNIMAKQISTKWKRTFGEIERYIDFEPLQESAVRMTQTIPSKGFVFLIFSYSNFQVSL